MKGATLADKLPIERALRNFVGGWVAGHAEGWQGSQGQALPPRERTDEEWEASLRQQNAANDELCSENGRLRAEVERLLAEERAAAASAANADGEAAAAAGAADASGGGEAAVADEELQGAVREALRQAAEQWRASLPEEEGPQADAWSQRLLLAVEEAVGETFREDMPAASAPAACGRSQVEETVALVEEKLMLRELVQRQQERIEELESELHASGAAPGSALTDAVARGLSDAGGALSAGISAVLLAQQRLPPRAVATVGCEYEIISKLGAIVRRGESLRSDQVAELAPGSRVRVMAVSERYPRRVEIVFVGSGGGPGVQPDGSCDGGGALSWEADSEKSSACDGSATTARDSPDASPQPAAAGAGQHAQGPVVGWISATAKDGRMLIRPAAAEHAGGEAAPEPEGRDREEGQEEIKSVTLSRSEWEGVHQAHDASMRRIEALSERLTQMGRELLQSFEMRSVLSEQQLGVKRARERLRLMEEHVAMAEEELHQRQLERHMRRTGSAAAVAPVADAQVAAGEQVAAAAVPKHGAEAPCDGAAAGSQGAGRANGEAPAPGSMVRTEHSPVEAVTVLDWDRLFSERETTALALSAGLQRLASLEREAVELDRDLRATESAGHRELSKLRGRLRQLAQQPDAAAPRSGEGAGRSSGSSARPGSCPAVAEGLFRRRVEDLQRHVEELQGEVQRATTSEAALRVSLRARTSALRGLLRLGVLAGLRIPQCGPIRMQVSPEAERDALRAAVEEQLRWNLRLRSEAAEEAGGEHPDAGEAAPALQAPSVDLLTPPPPPRRWPV